MKTVPCPEESPSGHDQNSQADTATPTVTTRDEKPRIEGKEISPDRQAHPSESNVDVAKPSTIPPTTPEGSDKDSCVVPSSQEGKNRSLTYEKVSLPSPRGTLVVSPSQGGNVSSGKAEKASEDGYNWRKYGQKNVKANEFIRSYYKCTHRNCLVKKQVERSLEGQITDTVYFGQHDHPKPHINVPLAVGLVVSVVDDKLEKPSTTKSNGKPSEVRGQTFHQVKTPDTPLSPSVTSVDDKSMVLHSPRSRSRDEVDNDDDPRSKRKKKENRSVDAAVAEKATGESRLTIQTASEVDIVNDGYRWRKYGQKLVKGNPNPRSYYRCSNPGCPVKKHVERASHDPKVVMTTYEGEHDHDKPTARTVTRNLGGMSVQNDEAKSEGGTVSGNASVGVGNLDPPTKSTEQQIVKFESKFDGTKSTAPVCENEQKQGKEETPSPCKSEGGKGDAEEPVPLSRITGEQPNNQLAAKPEESEGICHNKVGNKSNEQQQVLNTAATVQS